MICENCLNECGEYNECTWNDAWYEYKCSKGVCCCDADTNETCIYFEIKEEN